MKIFIDTAPFIYLIERHPDYIEPIKRYFTELYTDQAELITSVISLSEFGVKPQREGKTHLIHQFEEFMEKVGIKLIELNKQHARESYKFRGKYQFLKGMDSLQIGVAKVENCDKFFTNDIKLSTITELEIVLVKDLK